MESGECTILNPVPLGPSVCPSQGVDFGASVTPLGVSMCKSPHNVPDSAGIRREWGRLVARGAQVFLNLNSAHQMVMKVYLST